MSKAKPLPARTTPVNMEPVALVSAPPLTYQHRTIFCPESEERFNSLADDMEKTGYELVNVVAIQRYTAGPNGNGYTRGWQTFWRRVKREEKQG